MNEFDTSAINGREDAHTGGSKKSSALVHSRQPAIYDNDRLAELELENSRLHRLVADLLLKNQQLRKTD